MTMYSLGYVEQQNVTWTREIEALTYDEAQEIMLQSIQGEEPDRVDVIDTYWEDGNK